MAGHIVALGGGGFSIKGAYTAVDDFILSLTGRQRPRVCFIPTASADSPPYIARFYRAFSDRCVATDLTLFDPPALPRQPPRTTDLAGSACPHYDGEAERRGRYHEMIISGLPSGYAADDDAALHFTGTALTEVVSDRPDAAAYRVEREADGIVETRLPARLLTTTS